MANTIVPDFASRQTTSELQLLLDPVYSALEHNHDLVYAAIDHGHLPVEFDAVNSVIYLPLGTIQAAAANKVQLLAKDWGAGDARLYVQSEAGGPVVIGNNEIMIPTGELYLWVGDEDPYIMIGADIEVDTGSGTFKVTGTFDINGLLTARIPAIVNAGNITLTSAQTRGQFVYITATGTVILPSVSSTGVGASVTIYSTTAAVIYVDPNGNDRIILDGAAGGEGKKITSDGTAGALVMLHADSDDGWTVISRVATWTMEA